jgi:hypothetical protein
MKLISPRMPGNVGVRGGFPGCRRLTVHRVVDRDPTVHPPTRIALQQQRTQIQADLPDRIVGAVCVVVHHPQQQRLILDHLVVDLKPKPVGVEDWIQSFPLDVGFVGDAAVLDFDIRVRCVVRSVHHREISKTNELRCS